MSITFFNKLYKKPVSGLMKTGFLFLLAISAVSAKAQQNKLPPFRMFLETGTVFKAEQLPLGKPIVLIYFLPDCEHCQLLTQNIVKHLDELKGFSVVMVTYYPPAEVGRFARRYGLDKHSNFYLGTEGNFFYLKNYYNLSKLPFAALYTQNGNLIKTYNSEDFFSDFLREIKKVK